MKQLIKTILLSGFFIFMVASPILATASPVVSSVSSAASCEARVLGVPPWYRGLTNNDYPDCAIKSPDTTNGNGVQAFIWTIVLNVIEMGLVIVVYLAIFYILYGGFRFIVGGSTPDSVAQARRSILNAVIGLIIAMSAIAVTNLIFSIIK